jgi:hypothetical protein
MEGKIYKSNDGWVINYTDVKYCGGNPKVLGSYDRRISISSVPLHPNDVKTFDKLPQYTPEDGTKVRFKKVKLNPMGREVDPMNLTQNQSGCVWYGKLIPEVEDKEEQKLNIIEVMKLDEELGLYDEDIDDIKLEEVLGSNSCLYSVIENKLDILYRNQEKILSAIKMLNKNNGKD